MRAIDFSALDRSDQATFDASLRQFRKRGDAQTIRRGYELNYNLISLPTTNHEGEINPEHSFIELAPDNLVLTAVKEAESGDGLILRFYEWAGKEIDAKIMLPPGAISAEETDLIERLLGKLSLNDGAVVIHPKPYEIKTIRVAFGLPPAEPPY